MNTKTLYLLGAIVGTLLPLSQFFSFLSEHGFDVSLFFEQLWATPISSFFGWDVIISVLVLFVFIASEGHRLSRNERILCYVMGFCVGCSSGLPLFLYMRQRNQPLVR